MFEMGRGRTTNCISCLLGCLMRNLGCRKKNRVRGRVMMRMSEKCDCLDIKIKYFLEGISKIFCKLRSSHFFLQKVSRNLKWGGGRLSTG
jgi:hypothetical protein